MSTVASKERALAAGFVPVLPHPQWRMHLCVKRVACGCYLRVHTNPKVIGRAATQCPRCNDATQPNPVTDLADHSDTTYDNYRQQVLRDTPHLAAGHTDVLDKVFDRFCTEMGPPPKPSTAIIEDLMDEVATNVQHLLKHHRKPYL